MIEENDIKQIDLLKIDVEGAEIEVLSGIRDHHWARINQIVAEIHSPSLLKSVGNLLKDKGYNWTAEEDLRFKGAGLFNLYASR